LFSELHTSLLLPVELMTTAGRTLTAVAPVTSQEPFLQKIATKIEEDKNELEVALNRERGSEYTQQLMARDSGRDNAFTAFRDYVKACTRRSQPEIVDAAELIVNAIRKQGWTLYLSGYARETASLNMLFNDLSSHELTAAIQTIGAQLWLDDLKAAQTAFEETYQTKVSTETQIDYPALRDAKMQLGRHLNTLLDCIQILLCLGETETYEPIANQLNEIITDVMTSARARRTREKNVDDTDAE
jgi:hypothetical protein